MAFWRRTPVQTIRYEDFDWSGSIEGHNWSADENGRLTCSRCSRLVVVKAVRSVDDDHAWVKRDGAPWAVCEATL